MQNLITLAASLVDDMADAFGYYTPTEDDIESLIGRLQAAKESLGGGAT